jgi:hypothetical protein
VDCFDALRIYLFAFLSLQQKFNIVSVGGKTDWSKYLPQQGYVTIINIDSKEQKFIPQIQIAASNILNPRSGISSYTPKIIFVDSPIYQTFEIISRLPSSFYPPKNYFWKCNDVGSVFLVLTKESAITG